MCTLIIGRDVVAPGTVLLGANRDEDPGRPSFPPAVLSDQPPLVGGRDGVAGGTWLAIRARVAAIAILNRRDAWGEPAPPMAGRRSRGLLALDVAGAADEVPITTTAAEREELERAGWSELSARAYERAKRALAAEEYAPFSLVFASARSCWLLTADGPNSTAFVPITPGWHVLTHADLDDRGEPRTARVLDALARVGGGSPTQVMRRIGGLLGSHGGGVAGAPAAPAVCLHQGHMITVSSSLVWLAQDQAQYLHAEGPPCTNSYVDRSSLLAPTA